MASEGQAHEADAVLPLSGDVQPAAGASTSEQRCPVCLEDFEDKAFVDSCFHVFCFACIVQWSEVANSCPMCKTPFRSVIHNVRANDDYEKFEIRSKATPSHQEISLNAARRFHYRTTRFSGQQREQQRERRRRDSRKPAVNERRRMVYSSGLKALPMETTGEKRTRVRNISASFFCENPACTHRLVPWLNRELTVLLGKEHVDFMMQIIMSLIDKVDLESAEFAQHIEPFLHEKTSHFMHEFVRFAKSPFDMIAYDRRVRYEWPRSLRPPDNWDPEATQQQTTSPGPSGLSGMRQRIFEELTATRWDDSPPFLPTTASSPIVIHGSDSESEEEEPPRPSSFRTTSQSSIHPSSRPTVRPSTHTTPVQSSTHTTIVQPPTHTTIVQPPTHTTIVNPSTHTTIVQPSIYTTFVRPSTHPPTMQPMPLSTNTLLNSSSSSQSVPSTRAAEEGTVRDILTMSAEEKMGPVSEGQSNAGSSQGYNRGDVNSTTVDLICSPEVTTTETSAAATETEGQRSLEKEEEGAEVEESYAVSIHGDNMDDLDISGNGSFISQLDDERTRKKGEKHVKEKALERNRCHSYSKAESDQRRYSHKHRERDRDRGERGRERLQDRHHRSESDDSDSYRRRRRRRRRRQYDRREDGGGRSHVHERHFGGHDYERHTDLYHASSSFYQREKECHRSRLYSDDYPHSRGYPGGSRVGSESKERSSDSVSPEDFSSSKRRRPWRRQASGSHSRSQHSEERRERRRYHSEEREVPQPSLQRLKSEVRKATHQDPAQKKLAEELNILDAEIKENKKKLLKSLLHRERLELLHRSLHEEQSSSDVGPSTYEIEPVSISPSTPTVEIVRELSYLDRAIIDGKKQLLRVLKKMEEERGEESMDSN